MTTVVCATQTPGAMKGVQEAATMTYRVRLPYIKNKSEIKAGETVIGQHKVQEKKKSAPKSKTWHDDVVAEDRKRRKRDGKKNTTE